MIWVVLLAPTRSVGGVPTSGRPRRAGPRRRRLSTRTCHEPRRPANPVSTDLVVISPRQDEGMNGERHRHLILEALRSAHDGLDTNQLAEGLDLHRTRSGGISACSPTRGSCRRAPNRLHGRGRPSIVHRLTGEGIARGRDEYRCSRRCSRTSSLPTAVERHVRTRPACVGAGTSSKPSPTRALPPPRSGGVRGGAARRPGRDAPLSVLRARGGLAAGDLHPPPRHHRRGTRRGRLRTDGRAARPLCRAGPLHRSAELDYGPSGSAGPVSHARPSARRTRRSPPGKWTSTSPSRCVAAATATALVPEAAVSPTPRSQTRAVTSPGRSMRDDLDVRPLREARMRLEARAELADPLRIANDDCVRVADRDRSQLDAVDDLGRAHLHRRPAPTRRGRPPSAAPPRFGARRGREPAPSQCGS